MKKIANLWLDYIPNSYTECHPVFLRDKIFSSINVANSLLDNGERADAHTYFRKKGSLQDVISPTFTRQIKNRLFRTWENGRFNAFVLRTLKEQSADLAFLHFGTTAAQLIPALRKINIPSVVIFYGSDASSALRQENWRAKYREMFPLLAKVIVLCEPVRQRLVQAGCPENKIIVWNLPAGIEKYPYQARSPGEVVRFVMCARFIEKKGHSLLLEAYKRLLDSGRKVELTLMGYGNAKNKIIHHAESLGIAGKVVIIDTQARGDFHRAYNEELKTKDIFVLPSLTAANGDDEGGPALTLVCAQSAGLPVICTPFPGSEITLQDSQTGVICKENDVDSLHEKMLYLMDRPNEWDRLGRAGSKLVHEAFSEKGQIGRIASLFNELIV